MPTSRIRVAALCTLAVAISLTGTAGAATKKTKTKKAAVTTTVSPATTARATTAPPATTPAPASPASLEKLTEPFKILVISPETAAATNLPETQAGARAAAKALNDTGGIRGATVVIDWCDEKGDTNAAAACGRKASDGYSLVITGGRVSTAVLGGIGSTRVPINAPSEIRPETMSDDRMMFTDGGTAGGFAVYGFAAAKAGGKKIVIVRPGVDAAIPIANFVRAGAVAGGATVLPDIAFPPVLTDGGPTAGLIRASGADTACLVNNAGNTPLLLTALRQQQVPVQICMSLAALTLGDIDRLGPTLLDGVIAGDVIPPITLVNRTPDADRYINDLVKAGYEPKENLGSGGARAYSLVLATGAIARKSEKVDGPSMITAMNNTKDLPILFFGKWSPGKKGPKGLERVPNVSGFAVQYTGKEPKLIQKDPYDLSSAFG